MLILSRKPGEKVVIGDGITITVLRIIGDRAQLGIEAPADVRILRSELGCWLEPGDGQAEPDAVVPPK
jgi:carbon storage regulator